MFTEYTRLLSQEAALFKAALDTEQEKRKYIMSAHGPKLQALTDKTEVLLDEIRGFSEKREQLTAELPGEQEPTLANIVKLALEQNFSNQPELERAADHYRQTAILLKQETEENNRLLIGAENAIERMLGNLKKLSSGAPHTYSPSGVSSNRERENARSVILNANA